MQVHRVPRQRDTRLDGALVRLFPGLFVLRLSSSFDSRLLAQESLPAPAQIGSHPAFTGPRLADRSPGCQTAAGTGSRKGSAYAPAGRGQAADRANMAHAADCHSPRPSRLHPGIGGFRSVLPECCSFGPDGAGQPPHAGPLLHLEARGRTARAAADRDSGSLRTALTAANHRLPGPSATAKVSSPPPGNAENPKRSLGASRPMKLSVKNFATKLPIAMLARVSDG